MGKFNVETYFEQVESFVRQGNITQAQEHLQKILKPKSLSQPLLIQYCGLLKRTGSVLEAMKILWSYIKDQDFPRPDTISMWLEYSDCHTRLNATSTALRILYHPLLQTTPLTNLYLGFAHMHTWEYQTAAVAIQKFLAHCKTEDYNYWVARVNLVACFLENKKSKGVGRELDLLRTELRSRGFLRLLYNCFELRIRYFISIGHRSEVDQTLADLQGLELRHFGTLDELYMRKWKAFDLLEKQDPSAMVEMKKVRDLCHGNLQGEVARHIDLKYGQVLHDTELLKHLWFGSPYKAFRSELDMPTHSFNSYVLKLTGKKQKTHSPTVIHQSELKALLTPLVFRLISALTCDFYLSPNIIQLFERIYPGRYFNPSTSPNLIHQLLLRLRDQCNRLKLHLDVVCKNSHYYLTSNFDVHIVLDEPSWQILQKSAASLELDRILPILGKQFSARQVSELLKRPHRSVQFLLKKLVEEGALIKIGNSTHIMYAVPTIKSLLK